MSGKVVGCGEVSEEISGENVRGEMSSGDVKGKLSGGGICGEELSWGICSGVIFWRGISRETPGGIDVRFSFDYANGGFLYARLSITCF